MISLSPAAAAAVAEFFDAESDTPRIIRLFISPGSCSGPVLNMALDQVDPDDITAELGGVTFCMTHPLAERVGDVSIDMEDGNFVIRCQRPVVDPSVFAGCSCCSGGCGGESSGGCDCGSGGCGC